MTVYELLKYIMVYYERSTSTNMYFKRYLKKWKWASALPSYDSKN